MKVPRVSFIWPSADGSLMDLEDAPFAGRGGGGRRATINADCRGKFVATRKQNVWIGQHKLIYQLSCRLPTPKRTNSNLVACRFVSRVLLRYSLIWLLPAPVGVSTGRSSANFQEDKCPLWAALARTFPWVSNLPLPARARQIPREQFYWHSLGTAGRAMNGRLQTSPIRQAQC